MVRLSVNSVVFPLLLTICLVRPIHAADDSPKILKVSGEIEGIHDPAIIQQGDTWYLFSTRTSRTAAGELPIHCSHDLHEWRSCGSVLTAIPEWIKQRSPATKNLWAPDISYFHGLYHLYYAFSAFGVNTSGIALLTNKTLDQKSPDYHWNDEGLVLESKPNDGFNAIDPNLVLDGKGGAWLAFGSFWTGIKMRRIDRKTGKVSAHDSRLYSLASRSKPADAAPAKPGLPADWQAIEAPFVLRHGCYLYLFVSYDLCCRGSRSSYKIAVGRGKSVTGPYLDRSGKPMSEGGGTVILQGNDRWAGPGGQSALSGTNGDIMVFHAYDRRSGRPSLQISTIGWKHGWPELALERRSGGP